MYSHGEKRVEINVPYVCSFHRIDRWMRSEHCEHRSREQKWAESSECQVRGQDQSYTALWPLVQLSSVAQSCLTPCAPMGCSTPAFPVHRELPEFTQIHVNWVGDAIQSSHPLSSPTPPAFNLSQHQGLFRWVSSSHQVAKVLEFQLQHQSFQWTPRTDLL